MRCLIVDDEEMSRTNLQLLCEKIEDLEIVGICKSALDAFQWLQKDSVDLLFLDIEMPGLTGIELVRNASELPLVIFTTSKTDYAVEAFDLKELVVDYITKPVTLPRLLKALERVRKLNVTPPIVTGLSYIFIKTDKRLVRIDLEDLLYVETVGDYVLFKTKDQQYIVHSSLKGIDEKLQHPNFLKVHRSYIVNLTKIVDIEENTLVIEKKVIPVSRAHKGLLMQKINLI
jgi:two-component system response regulator LytT